MAVPHTSSQRFANAAPPLTLEAGIVRVADALDMAKGRSRIPFERGRVSIHSLSAAAIESVPLPTTALQILVLLPLVALISTRRRDPAPRH